MVIPCTNTMWNTNTFVLPWEDMMGINENFIVTCNFKKILFTHSVVC